MNDFKNPYHSLIEKRKAENPDFAKKVENEPDFFGIKNRIEGAVATSGKPLKNGVAIAEKNSIIEALETVEDPEIPVDIYNLGLIYKCEQQDNGNVDIVMTLTAPNCPVAGEIPQWVADAVSPVVGVGTVNVELTWEPKWTKDMMSEDAKMALDFF